MISRLALFAASLAASLVLAASLALAGFAPGAAPTATTSDAAAPSAADVAAAAPQVQVDTVYLAPPPAQQTITVHKVVKGSGEDGEGSENEGDD